MISLSLSWYRLTRPVRLRCAVRRYERHLRALRRDTIPYVRAGRLDLLAVVAGAAMRPEDRDEWDRATGRRDQIAEVTR